MTETFFTLNNAAVPILPSGNKPFFLEGILKIFSSSDGKSFADHFFVELSMIIFKPNSIPPLEKRSSLLWKKSSIPSLMNLISIPKRDGYFHSAPLQSFTSWTWSNWHWLERFVDASFQKKWKRQRKNWTKIELKSSF